MKRIVFLLLVVISFVVYSCSKSSTSTCPTPNAGVIIGATNVDKGNTITLSDSVSGGKWSSSNTAIATTDSMGIVTGVAVGNAIVTYTTTNLCGKATAIYPITINTTLIGTSYGGGIIAYILQPGDPGYSATVQHGLIVATTDQSTGITWFNGSYIPIGATGTTIGTGLANTNVIIAAQGAGSYAASVCKNLILGGYNDWYLPSKDELNKLYVNKNLINGFAAAYYWSSSETDYDSAWNQYYVGGHQDSVDKGLYAYVRAVRSF